MKYNELGESGIKVSEICLGSMTWGSQNTEVQAHQQMDLAVSKGVNFFDTAELYPTTPKAKQTQGRSEEIIGSWFKQSSKRDAIILGTKVTGRGPTWIQNGRSLSAQKIRQSLDESLTRLGTDYIDLYQLHWPNRETYHFRQTWGYDPTNQDTDKNRANFLEVLTELGKQIKAGKIRTIGLSNETCWGTSQYLAIAKAANLPRVAAVQNEYSLLHRIFDLDLAELAHHEKVGLLAFSPLATGLLSGKYRSGQVPPKSRMSLDPDLSGRRNPISEQAIDNYFAIAQKFQLELAQMALAFCVTRPFITSTIVGATSLAQLETNLGATDIELSDDVLEDIAQVHRNHPIPM